MVKNGRFTVDAKFGLDEYLRVIRVENVWRDTTVPEGFIRTVFCAAGNALLKRRRARLLCDAYAAGHASVLQVWRHHVAAGVPDVIKLIDQLRTIQVTEFATQDAADAAGIAVKVAAN
jgi:hypothetical protein